MEDSREPVTEDAHGRRVEQVRRVGECNGIAGLGPDSRTVTCRSNFAAAESNSTSETARSPRVNSAFPRFWNVSITWNSGCRACERAGSRISTSRSNGTSACPNAARSDDRTCPSSSSNDAPGCTSARSTRVLTNMPITSSRTASPRPATGVPIAMSDVPLNRASSTDNAACTTMNGVTECWRANSSTARDRSASSANRCVAP